MVQTSEATSLLYSEADVKLGFAIHYYLKTICCKDMTVVYAPS